MITICGTHGSVNFDDSGIRLPDQEDYPEIDRLDVEEFKKFYGFVPESEDILNLGYWTHDGVYEPAEADWRIDRMKEAIMHLVSRSSASDVFTAYWGQLK